jgi:hypothetical protein
MSGTSTVFVTLSDEGYFVKAKRTILELRVKGGWHGSVVLIAVGFRPPENWCQYYEVEVVNFPRINVDTFVSALQCKPFTIPTDDGRELKKTVQWEKLHAFDPFFKQWNRLVFIDAGLRILDRVDSLLSLDWKGKFLAPDDTAHDPDRTYAVQLELKNYPEIIDELSSAYPTMLSSKYFLNCIWVYDTSLNINKDEFTDLIGKYPIWRCNEMGVMNLVLCFKHPIWHPFPDRTHHGKILFDWTERGAPTWRSYVFIKYPRTIPFDC